MKPYSAVFSRAAFHFLVDAQDEVFREVERWVARIEVEPFREGDFRERDDTGREIQVIILSGVAVSYWADHAEREVRVVRIDELAG